MPIVQCERCGIRQYAAKSYVREPRCLRCEAPLGRPKLPPRAGAETLRDRAGQLTTEGRPR